MTIQAWMNSPRGNGVRLEWLIKPPSLKCPRFESPLHGLDEGHRVTDEPEVVEVAALVA